SPVSGHALLQADVSPDGGAFADAGPHESDEGHLRRAGLRPRQRNVQHYTHLADRWTSAARLRNEMWVASRVGRPALSHQRTDLQRDRWSVHDAAAAVTTAQRVRGRQLPGR